jgi:hypothetical protein
MYAGSHAVWDARNVSGMPVSRARVEFAPRPATAFVVRRLVLYAAIVAALLVDGSASRSRVLLVIAAVMALIGGIPVLLAVRFAKRGNLAAWVDREGVWWRESGRVLPWSEIERVEVRRATRAQTIFGVYGWIGFVDRQAQSFATRAGTRPTLKRLSTRHVDADVDDVLAAVRRFAPPTILGPRTRGDQTGQIDSPR